jgi:ArsR family transcriptional regulator
MAAVLERKGLSTLQKKVGADPTPPPEDLCEVPVIHVEKVRAVKERLLPSQTVQGLAELFKVMGDPSRAKIIYALSEEELCVCDLAAVLGMSVSAVSHHLRLLRNLRLVKFRKEGRMVYYSLDDQHVMSIFMEGLKHVEEQ